MARNDYNVIVFKFLKYLYTCLINGEKADVNALSWDTGYFPGDKTYWEYVWEHLFTEGLVENVTVIPVDNRNPMIHLNDTVRISPKGIEFLEENKMMKKVADVFAKQGIVGNAIGILQLFM